MILLKDGRYSYSALFCAYVRAYHASCDPPHIFNDFLAHRLIPEDIRISLEHEMVWNFQSHNPGLALLYPDQASTLALIMQTIITPPAVLGRARYVEDSLERAVRDGVKQYVLLGAGMDTFAYRSPEMLEQLRVFEVDHPATQAFKLRRVAELGWQQPNNLHFVPVDFTTDNLAAVLQDSPYDPQALSFFNWLGVTYYLPSEAVLATLRTITEIAPAGSRVVFDYFDSAPLDLGKTSGRVRWWRMEGSDTSDEPLQTCLDPSRLASDLAGVGLRLQENLSSADIQDRYFQGRSDGYRALKQAHFAMAVVD